jgi:protein-S-isoprenylcysteine O-methyltransferase Ste14
MSTATPTPSQRFVLLRPRVLDRIEQIVIVAVWSLFVWRSFHGSHTLALDAASLTTLALLVSETSVMLFTLIRRPTGNISLRPGDWMLATTATLAPLMIDFNIEPNQSFAYVGLFLLLFGNCWQAWAKLILRRSFGITPANRGIKISGAYRFVRHPMYAGYLAVHAGYLSVMFSPFNLMVYSIAWTAQVLRLLAEERLLGEDPAYRDYMSKVRWRLVPGVF